MECRKFEITLLSSQNLENVRRVFKNRVRVYAKVSLGDNPSTEKKTPEDKDGQTNPVWNFNASYTIADSAVNSQDINLLIRFYCVRTSGDADMGEVSVSLKELIDRFSTLPEGEETAKVSYPVKTGGKDSAGEVSFSYKFGDVFVYEPPSIDWGKLVLNGSKLGWKGTEFVFKGGVLCLRLIPIKRGNYIDTAFDIAQTSSDIIHTLSDVLGQIFGGRQGDCMARFLRDKADIPIELSHKCSY